jgi:Fe2+ or Zn2+ uptake regulation protein
MSDDLSQTQRRIACEQDMIHEYMLAFQRQHGQPPTITQISHYLYHQSVEFAFSRETVWRRLKQLERAGRVVAQRPTPGRGCHVALDPENETDPPLAAEAQRERELQLIHTYMLAYQRDNDGRPPSLRLISEHMAQFDDVPASKNTVRQRLLAMTHDGRVERRQADGRRCGFSSPNYYAVDTIDEEIPA